MIKPRARATAAGLMNAAGWGGGALGPLAVGLATEYGHHGDAVAFSGVVYAAAGLLLLAAARSAGRDSAGRPAPAARNTEP